MNLLNHLKNMFLPKPRVTPKVETPNPELPERNKLIFETAMMAEATDRLVENAKEIKSKLDSRGTDIDRFAALLRSMRTMGC